MRVDEGGRLVVLVLVGVVQGLLGEESGLDFVCDNRIGGGCTEVGEGGREGKEGRK